MPFDHGRALPPAVEPAWRSPECRAVSAYSPRAHSRFTMRVRRTRRQAAPRIRRSAAARASSVTSAPASMRAISSRRRTAVERGDAGGHRLAAPDRLLGDQEMRPGPRRHLRRMGDGEHLHALGEPRQPHADGIGDGAADGGVDLVEDQGRRRAAIGERHLERQQEARQLAARGDLHQRPRLRCRDWCAHGRRRRRCRLRPARPDRCRSRR